MCAGSGCAGGKADPKAYLDLDNLSGPVQNLDDVMVLQLRCLYMRRTDEPTDGQTDRQRKGGEEREREGRQREGRKTERGKEL